MGSDCATRPLRVSESTVIRLAGRYVADGVATRRARSTVGRLAGAVVEFASLPTRLSITRRAQQQKMGRSIVMKATTAMNPKSNIVLRRSSESMWRRDETWLVSLEMETGLSSSSPVGLYASLLPGRLETDANTLAAYRHRRRIVVSLPFQYNTIPSVKCPSPR